MSDEGSEMVTMRRMPEFRATAPAQTIWAYKIASVLMKTEGGATISPADPGYASFDVSKGFANAWLKDGEKLRHGVEGGYYVNFPHGRAAVIDARAFEIMYEPLRR
jgi:hypothetical protein